MTKHYVGNNNTGTGHENLSDLQGVARACTDAVHGDQFPQYQITWRAIRRRGLPRKTFRGWRSGGREEGGGGKLTKNVYLEHMNFDHAPVIGGRKTAVYTCCHYYGSATVVSQYLHIYVSVRQLSRRKRSAQYKTERTNTHSCELLKMSPHAVSFHLLILAYCLPEAS